MEMIICTHQVLVKVKGDCEYRTLALAVKRMSQLPYVHDYFKILCSSFWREENLPKLEFSLKKKVRWRGGRNAPSADNSADKTQGLTLGLLNPQFLLSLERN